MRKVKQLGRRSFLMSVGKGSFALLSEMTFGLGRRGLAMALGGSGLMAACPPLQAPAAVPAPTAMAAANESIKKLATLTFETLVFGHGEPMEAGASEQVAALAASLE